MAPFSLTTTVDEVAADFADHIKGRTNLITGISPNSLGGVAAKSIAKHRPSPLIFASRTLSIHKVADDIKSEVPAVAILLSYPENIDIFIHNASIMGVDYALTPDGIESQIRINHLGHFLFTCLIMPKIVAAGPGSRIVVVSSRGHRFSDVLWDDVNFSDGKEFERFAAYGQSKRANMLFALALSERLSDKGVTVFSMHAGAIPKTNLVWAIPTEALEALDTNSVTSMKVTTDSTGKRKLVTHNPDGRPLTTADGRPVYKTLAQGSAMLVRAAFDPSIVSENGRYLYEGMLQEDIPDTSQHASPYAQDREAAGKLWAVSEELVGQEFNI